MTAWPNAPVKGGVLAAALARAEAFLLEPPVRGAAAPPLEQPPRPAVAVRGLARGCGASTVARALAVALARGDPSGTAILLGGPPGAGPRIAAPAALRMARALTGQGCDGVRASGRVCLVSESDALAAAPLGASPGCPIVIDVAHASPPGEGLGRADLAVLVTSPAVEAALAAAVETSLASAGHRVEVVINRVGADEPLDRQAPSWDEIVIGESRLAAQLALACREARGPFAEPIAELAERCRAAARG